MKRATLCIAVVVSLLTLPLRGQTVQWSYTGGPEIVDGVPISVTSICFDRDGRLFAGAAAGGLYRQSPESWTRIGSGQLPSSLMAIAASSHGTLLVSSLTGLYRSLDGGATWTNVATELSDSKATDIAFAPNGDAYIAVTDGVYRSTDDGEHWVVMGNGLPNGYAWPQIAVLPNGEVFLAKGTVYRSTDNGDSWREAGQTDGNVIDMAADGTGCLVAVTAHDVALRSTDRGATWAGAIVEPTGSITLSSVAVTRDGLMVVGSNRGVYLEDDGGFTAINTGLSDHSVTSLAVDAAGIVFAGTGEGVFVTTQAISDVESPAVASAPSFAASVAPNPAAGTATVHVTLVAATELDVTCYDALGRSVATVHTGRLDAGEHDLRLDLSTVDAGVVPIAIRERGSVRWLKLMHVRP